MSEEADAGVEVVVMEDEQIREEREVIGIQGWSSPVRDQSTVIMTGDEITNESLPVKEVREDGLGLVESSSSPIGSFQSLHSRQNSEKDKMIPCVSPLEEIRVLQFEDTLSEMDHRNFNLIYESLLS